MSIVIFHTIRALQSPNMAYKRIESNRTQNYHPFISWTLKKVVNLIFFNLCDFATGISLAFRGLALPPMLGEMSHSLGEQIERRVSN